MLEAGLLEAHTRRKGNDLEVRKAPLFTKLSRKERES